MTLYRLYRSEGAGVGCRFAGSPEADDWSGWLSEYLPVNSGARRRLAMRRPSARD